MIINLENYHWLNGWCIDYFHLGLCWSCFGNNPGYTTMCFWSKLPSRRKFHNGRSFQHLAPFSPPCPQTNLVMMWQSVLLHSSKSTRFLDNELTYYLVNHEIGNILVITTEYYCYSWYWRGLKYSTVINPLSLIESSTRRGRSCIPGWAHDATRPGAACCRRSSRRKEAWAVGVLGASRG